MPAARRLAPAFRSRTGGATGCALHAKNIAQTVVTGLDYERLFPRYVEVCAVSQIRSTFAPHGGTPGHAVMYLKGACLDADAGYPRLRLCDHGEADFSSGETGTGVSVNKAFIPVGLLPNEMSDSAAFSASNAFSKLITPAGPAGVARLVMLARMLVSELTAAGCVVE